MVFAGAAPGAAGNNPQNIVAHIHIELILDPALDGYLVTKSGDLVLGENGPVRLKKNNFVVDEDGVIWQNASLAGDPQRLVSQEENEWDSLERVDRLKIVEFPHDRYLRKQGDSYWEESETSGPAEVVGEEARPKVRQGFLEGSNVNPVTEMVRMIEVTRAFESAQKVVSTQDELLSGAVNTLGRVKAG